MQQGYQLYVAGFLPGLVKIGYSRDPAARIRHLSSLIGVRPSKYQAFDLCDRTKGRMAERAVFKLLAAQRVGKGEFVRISYRNAVKAAASVVSEICGGDHAA